MRILIVDDHELIQTALRHTLVDIDAHCVVDTALDFEAAARVINRSPPFDLVLLDLGLPGMDGLRSLVEMRSRYPDVPVVVVSGQSDRVSVVQAINLGAMGFIPKSESAESIVAALRTIVAGKIYVPAETMGAPENRRTLKNSRHGNTTSNGNSGADELPRAIDFGLTNAQRKVLALLLRGLPNKLICRELHVEESTVKTHIKGIFAALNVRNRTQAVLAASQLGINVSIPPASSEHSPHQQGHHA